MNQILSKKDVIVLEPSSRLQEAIAVFSHFKISHCPIVDNKKLVGMVTKTKVLDSVNRSLVANNNHPLDYYFSELTVGEIMHRDVIQLPLTSKMSEILEAMDGNEVGSIVLCEDGKIKGIVTETDIVRFMRREFAQQIQVEDDNPQFVQRLALWLYDHGVIAVSKALGDIGI